MYPIKLGIVDDQILFLKGLKMLVNSFKNIELVLEALNGNDLLHALQEKQPDVLLMDLKMPGMDGIEATEKVKASYPDIKIILLSMHDDEQLIAHLMKIGANGYLIKNEQPAIVEAAIHAVMEKGFYFNDYVSKAMMSSMQKANRKFSPESSLNDQVDFTKRELEVLNLICREHTTAEIAKQLFISNRTVESHRKNLLEKSGVRNMAGLVVYAMQNNLVDLIS
jgi:DNA-binding NarL/FixJ family response regulator